MIAPAILDYLEKKYAVTPQSAAWNAAAALLTQLENGSVCIDSPHIESAAIGNENQVTPIIYHKGKLYFQKYWKYQKIIVETIRNLAEKNRLKIISGGPGSGKTTSLVKLLRDILEKTPKARVQLAAPTGKAAARMKQVLENIEATTIHRLLGYKKLSAHFRHNRENPLKADVIVIDECSMVDLPLMAKLCQAMPPNCELILLGDKYQLSSVEVGSVFSDICAAFRNMSPPLSELTASYRFDPQRGIGKISRLIKDNAIEDVIEYLKANGDEEVRFEQDKKVFFEKIIKEWERMGGITAPAEALERLHGFQILTAFKRGELGMHAINKRMLDFATITQAKFVPIIITQNNYAQKLFNGDTGIHNAESGMAYFKSSEGEIREFPLQLLPDYDYAYAITIHKSQGSEYEKVAVIIPPLEQGASSTENILSKELIYTAITRAKKHVLLFSEPETLRVSLAKNIKRASGIDTAFEKE